MCLPIIGGILSGVGAAMGAMSSAASHKANAALERRQAEIETRTGAYKADRTQEQVDRVLGNQRAAFAASGLALDGSPGDVIDDTATEGALDVAAIRWNSSLTAGNYTYKSKISDMNAKNAAAAAPIAFLTPVIQGVASYASSFAGAA